MDIIKAILSAKNVMQAYKAINLDFTKDRYSYESLVLGYLSAYQLNIEKNRNKDKFEDVSLVDIYSHLCSEVAELGHELEQPKLDFERILSELGDVAAMCTGLMAWINEHKNN